jgi:hypothetical protein
MHHYSMQQAGSVEDSQYNTCDNAKADREILFLGGKARVREKGDSANREQRQTKDRSDDPCFCQLSDTETTEREIGRFLVFFFPFSLYSFSRVFNSTDTRTEYIHSKKPCPVITRTLFRVWRSLRSLCTSSLSFMNCHHKHSEIQRKKRN